MVRTYIVLLLILYISCTSKKNDKSIPDKIPKLEKAPTSFDLVFLSDTVKELFDKYCEVYEASHMDSRCIKHNLYQIFVEQQMDREYITFSMPAYQVQVTRRLPTYYIKEKDREILVYTPLDKFFAMDSSILESVSFDARKELLALDSYDCPIGNWKIEIKKDSIISIDYKSYHPTYPPSKIDPSRFLRPGFKE